MGYSNIIDYVNIASTGNAVDFGDLLAGLTCYPAGCSNGTRGIFSGGEVWGGPDGGRSDVVSYVTIDTTANSIDFGDLTVARNSPSAVSDGTKGVIGGGSEPHPGSTVNTIDYVNIASLGNASDFGDLTRTPTASVSASGD